MNPQHTVPTLDDNGKYLWDSHAIATYLIGKYGNSDDHPLYPKDVYTRARIDQRLHFESGIVFNPMATVVRAVIFEGATEFTEKQVEAIQEVYSTLETFLAVDLYLVGNQLTVADLCVAPSLTQLSFLVELDAIKYPKVTAWVKRLEELTYFYELNTKLAAEFASAFKGMIARNKENRAK